MSKIQSYCTVKQLGCHDLCNRSQVLELDGTELELVGEDENHNEQARLMREKRGSNGMCR